MHYRHVIAAFCGLGLLSACASSKPIGMAPNVEVAQLSGLPVPSGADYTPDVRFSTLRPLDTLQVDVFDVPELSKEVQVGVGGTVDFPLIGTIDALGMTTEEFAAEVERRLRGSYVLEPDVTARLTARSEQLFTISGEVDDPGRYPINAPITLIEAVAIGNGLAEYAKRDEVLVFRTVDDVRYIGVYNIGAIERGNYPDPQIYPGDIVVVGDSPNRRRLDQILAISSAVLSPLVLVERVLR
ncbi:polysaccharide biosynthesis/export family protein [Aurantiacibacter spongiae]|uniref:Polysaccharide export protein n=1 Tax=Aurantiacibacter spongiae TaxID=2488860 RepID=A0A3N5DFW5_9SPHN|nr:polysaccharide biosynthesis/export family protein [Aurantiacibacter spongiae]RPF70552.1 polysaccharide export protein [Aurantiacibacter spongiae]